MQGEQIEALKVAKSVIDHPLDLAGRFVGITVMMIMVTVVMVVIPIMIGMLFPAPAWKSSERRRYAIRIAAEALDPRGDQFDQPFPHRPPAIGGLLVRQTPFQDGESVLFDGQHHLLVGHRDSHLE